MNHGVEAGQIADLHIADVLPDRRHLGDGSGRLERGASVQIAVESDHLVPGVEEHRRERATEVAKMAGQQDA